jgi:hypothetical protein
VALQYIDVTNKGAIKKSNRTPTKNRGELGHYILVPMRNYGELGGYD